MAVFVNAFFAVLLTCISLYIGYEYYSQLQHKKSGKLVTKDQKETVESYLNIS